MNLNAVDASATYTTVDLNDTSGTTDLFDPSGDATVYGVYLRNGGSSAVVNLEVTDGSDTATVVNNRGSGGADIALGDTLALGNGDKLQVNVTTAEGSAQSNTAVVFKTE